MFKIFLRVLKKTHNISKFVLDFIYSRLVRHTLERFAFRFSKIWYIAFSTSVFVNIFWIMNPLKNISRAVLRTRSGNVNKAKDGVG